MRAWKDSLEIADRVVEYTRCKRGGGAVDCADVGVAEGSALSLTSHSPEQSGGVISTHTSSMLCSFAHARKLSLISTLFSGSDNETLTIS